MDITHMHLHVRDRDRSEAFYARWLGLQRKRRGTHITFMTGDRDFLLALIDDAAPAPLPSWFHFGVRLPSREAVRDLVARMQTAGVTITKPLFDDPEITNFRCSDPDGYTIEIYAEPA